MTNNERTALAWARIVMICSLSLGALITMMAYVWPTVIASVALDAILTPTELKTPEINAVAQRILNYDAQSRGTKLYAILGGVMCSVNLIGLMKLLHYESVLRRTSSR